MNRRRCRHFLFVLGIACAFAASACADTEDDWTGTTGNWSDYLSWSLGIPSSSYFQTDIDNGGTVQITSGSASANYLYLGDASTQSGTILLSGGTLTTTEAEFVGLNGTGAFTQTDGTNNPYALIVGTAQPGIGPGKPVGTYTLSSGGIVNASTGESIFAGEFDQNGGTNNAGALGIAYNGPFTTSGGNGTYRLAAGTLSATGLTVGTAGPGLFSQTGGTFTCSGAVAIDLMGQISLSGVADNFPSLSIDDGTLSLLGGSASAFAGSLTVAGNFTETSTIPVSAEINIGIGGTAAGSQYGDLTIDGPATFSGRLVITLTDGFIPAYGEVFDIIDSNSYSGTFSPSLPSGSWGSFALAYVPSGVTLTVVPEPSLIAGLAGAIFFAPRRQRKQKLFPPAQ